MNYLKCSDNYAAECMYNPSWVQCLPSSHSKLNLWGLPKWRSHPWWIKIVMAFLHITVRDESQTSATACCVTLVRQ